ncbi:uncharacterized protein LOC144360101 [Saccoglossus kowalevskii]
MAVNVFVLILVFIFGSQGSPIPPTTLIGALDVDVLDTVMSDTSLVREHYSNNILVANSHRKYIQSQDTGNSGIVSFLVDNYNCPAFTDLLSAELLLQFTYGNNTNSTDESHDEHSLQWIVIGAGRNTERGDRDASSSDRELRLQVSVTDTVRQLILEENDNSNMMLSFNVDANTGGPSLAFLALTFKLAADDRPLLTRFGNGPRC